MSSNAHDIQEQSSASSSGGNRSSSNDESKSNTPASSTIQGTTSPPGGAASDENLKCQWTDCHENFGSAEILYDHICEKHIGRKSTNNLNLTCQWNGCRTTTVKRDHITSHVRVHVPLKPHKCEFCNKTFKRPQDLKKHVKTHADDSVLSRGAESQVGGGLGMRHQMPPKGPTAPPSGYYDHNGQMRTNAGFAPPSGYPTAYHPSHPAHNPGYMQSMYMNTATTFGQAPRAEYMNHHHAAPSYDNRKRSYDMVDDFLGNVKRNRIDPSSYAQVSRALLPLHTAMQGVSAGPMTADYMPTQIHAPVPMSAHAQGPMHVGPSPLTQQYALPIMSNARSEKDLLQLDDLLEQMQATVYENSRQTMIPHDHMNARNTPSPVSVQSTPSSVNSAPYEQYNSSNTMGMNHIPSPLNSVSTESTPGLSPGPSSGLSYGHSPSPSASSMSPGSRHGSMGSSVMYPQVSGYSLPGTSPSPTLAGERREPGRRISNSMLQRARPAPMVKPEEPGSGATTPKAIESSSVGSPSGESDVSESTREREEKYDRWLEDMRTIENLRVWIARQLEERKQGAPGPRQAERSPKREERDADEMDIDKKSPPPPSLYPTIKA